MSTGSEPDHRSLDPTQLRHFAALEPVWTLLPQARLVGGVVRDLLAGRPSADIDLATPEPPEQVMRRLGEARIRCVPTGLSHGTVTAVVQGHAVEITTLRRDEATDGRHAVVAWTTDWREDAARRDFTINAMSLSRDHVLHDYFGGAGDLAAGCVRFVGEAGRRIEEDALRMLRFFRFQARYGTGTPDPQAVAAIAAGMAALDGLSAERVWSELRRILLLPASGTTGPQASLRLMQSLGILDRVLPGGADAGRLLLRLSREEVPDESREDAVLRLAALLRGPPGPVAAALRLSGAEAERLQGLLADRPAPRPGLDDASLRRMLADEPAGLLLSRSWLIQDDGDPSAWRQARDRLRRLPSPVFPLAGRDLLASGVAAGPAVGRLLSATRTWWREGGCIADQAGCLEHSRSAAVDAGLLPPALLPRERPGC